MGFFSWLKRKNKPRKLKLGLALGSGGAKGFASLGALKAFEENGLEFDIVAGTSIGSIIGAFYCKGYTATDIIELIKRVDFSEIKSLFMINMDTMGLFNVIDREMGTLNIEDLKKPFKAVATDLESGEEKVFDSGNVAKALCASSSMLPFFKPVVIDGKRYIDGAYTNSVPADLVKQMGADYVVGIDLSTRDNKQSLITKFFPSYKSKVEEPWAKGYEYSDVVLHPDLSGFLAYEFWKADKMFDIGYSEGIKYVAQIKKDILELSNKKR
ncbi:MAG: patatin-like phospholipase family protein [Clostridia bacterium]|nr:patatin-like phospholipase family protein [Clostridia bacterium]